MVKKRQLKKVKKSNIKLIILLFIIGILLYSTLSYFIKQDNLYSPNIREQRTNDVSTEEVEEGELLWSFRTTGNIYSTPAVSNDGIIYVGSYHALYAINSEGNLEWTYPTNGLVTSSPAIDKDGTIYFGGGSAEPPEPIPGWGAVGGGDTKLYAVNPDGTLRWSYNVGAAIDYTSPAIANDGTIYVVTSRYAGQPEPSRIIALNNDGTLRWSYNVGYWIFSAPAIARDGTIYFGSMDYNHEFYALNPDGTLRWSYNVGAWIVSSPAIANDGTIYIGTMDTSNSLIALNPDGTLKWRYPVGYWIRHSSPAIGKDGTIYVGTTDAQGDSLLALNPDGTLKWSYTTGYWVENQITVGDTGTIYFGDMNGIFYALRDEETQASVIWSFDTGYWLRSGAAIKNGVLYFGSYDNNLYAFNVQDQGLFNSAWPKYQRDILNTGRSSSLRIRSREEEVV